MTGRPKDGRTDRPDEWAVKREKTLAPLPPAMQMFFLLLAAVLPLAVAQYCPAGAASACSKVLILASDCPGCLVDARSTLEAMGAFTTVDAFTASPVNDGGSGTPTAAQLAAYDAVLVWQNYPFDDASLLGDRLAAYHDQGGGVVVASLANTNDYNRVQGAYGAVANGYALMDYASGSHSGTSDSLGMVVEAQSPLMTGVAYFTAPSAVQSTASVVAGRGVVVARWASGRPLVLRGARGNRTLVELNFFPVSSRLAWWCWSGDGGALLRNALKFSQCMPCGMGTYAGAGGWREEMGEYLKLIDPVRARLIVFLLNSVQLD